MPQPSNVVSLHRTQHVDTSAIRPSGLPLRDLLAQHRILHLPTLAPKSRSQYRSLAELVADLPDYPNPPDLAYLWTALACRYAPATINLLQRSLSALYQWGQRAGLSNGNPQSFVQKARPTLQPRSIPELERHWPRIVQTVRTEALEPDRAAGFLAVLRFAGLRLGEALALTARDVTVPWTAERPGGQLALGSVWRLHVLRQRAPNSWQPRLLKGRTEKNQRSLEVAGALKPYLEAVLSLDPAEIRRQSGERYATEYLFPFRALELDRFSKALFLAFPRQFQPGMRVWHAFRHSFAEALENAGIRRESIQAHLGHASLKTTEEYLRGLCGTKAPTGDLDRAFVAAGALGGCQDGGIMEQANAKKDEALRCPF